MNRISAFLGFALASVGSLPGQSTGLLAGRVIDGATQLSLAGVRVSVSGTALETCTSSTGRYPLPVVDEGSQIVVFSYVGCDVFSRPVTVAGPTRWEAQFGEGTIETDASVIEGSRSARPGRSISSGPRTR